MKIVLAGGVEGIKTRVDGSVTITYVCNELDPKQFGELYQLRNKFCKALFSDNNISALDQAVIDEAPVYDTTKVKSKSQRLRSVFFRIWEQQGSIGSFDEFYNSKMESVIEHYRSKLE